MCQHHDAARWFLPGKPFALLALVTLAACTAPSAQFGRQAGHDEIVASADRQNSSPDSEREDKSGRFNVLDYFNTYRVTELALSSDGSHLAYVLERLSLQQNDTLRQVVIRPVRGGELHALPLSDAHELNWVPNSHKLAFLSGRSGLQQIFTYDVALGGGIEQITYSSQSISKFKFSPTGKELVYLTASDPGPSLYQRFQTEGAGILVDPDTTSIFDFVDPTSVGQSQGLVLQLMFLDRFSAARAISVPGDVSDFHWSSDARHLSVAFISSEIPASVTRYLRTSIGVVDARSGQFSLLAHARAPSSNAAGVRYGGGQWIPGRGLVFVWRAIEENSWDAGTGEWAILKAVKPQEEHVVWRPADTYFGFAVTPIDDRSVFVEDTVSAERSLFRWTSTQPKSMRTQWAMNGSSSLFRFSADLRRVVFVNESLTRPQEIYFSDDDSPPRRLTSLNSETARKVLPGAKELSWTSTDGATVHGWLLEPPAGVAVPPWPLVTFVHGGPQFAFPNAFAPYFLRQSWPYPFEAYATHGIAVFIPNYRGTDSYGRNFGTPTSIDGEPLHDIETGIKYLVKTGIANPNRLGISGHSHGAWLGPLLMTRASIFRASSFAEGTPNTLVSYELMSGQMNREINDVVDGSSPYDSPLLYAQRSPGLHFKDVRAANLFEGGAWAEAIFMLGYGKASRRLGLPTEVVFYPRSGHNITIPRLQRESAERNLDWFRFWLKDELDPEPSKAEQYARWKRIRDKFLMFGTQQVEARTD